jgi:hypothetical protein
MRAKIGDWAKVTGGNSGIVYTKQGWKWFKCLTCARAAGLIVNTSRRQLADVSYIIDRCQKQRDRWIECGGAEAHNKYFEETGHL